jgi:hypothetical protein
VLQFIAANTVKADRPRCVQEMIAGMEREPAFERLVQTIIAKELRQRNL